ncbi:MAG: biopolymer transporter ExbD [Planctomycetaceae bacterium]
MPVRVQCPECGKQLIAGDDRIGKNSTCPQCRTKFPVRAAEHRPAADIPDRTNIPEEEFDGSEEQLEDDENESGGDGPLIATEADDGKYEDLVDMTAMVDIVFFLLIFFMLTSAAGVLSCVNLPAPKQEGAPAASKRPADLDQDSECVIVHIDDQNRIFIDEVPYPTESDLRDRLRSARVQAKKLLVKAHGNALNGTYVMVQDLGAELQFEEFLLSVAKEEEPQ